MDPSLLRVCACLSSPPFVDVVIPDAVRTGGLHVRCVECAANFNEEWEEYEGASTTNHVDSVLWLWKVHNLVRERLTLDDDSVGVKAQWPSLQQCDMCYTESVRNSSAGPSTDQWEESGWQQDFVFAYLQVGQHGRWLSVPCWVSPLALCLRNPRTGNFLRWL